MEDKVREFITMFLQFNPRPTDAQVHGLAAAMNCDKEVLESFIYAMLADTQEVKNDMPVVANLDMNEVLEDEVPIDQLPLNDIPMNDGKVSKAVPAIQNDTANDGTIPADSVGLSNTDSLNVLTDDGVPLVRI